MKGKNWIITKWCASITDSGKDETINQKPNNMPYKFRLLDDDGIIYAYGYSDDDSSFEPLDYYMPIYGCTTIEYKNSDGNYEEL